jgi:hypothetical protein
MGLSRIIGSMAAGLGSFLFLRVNQVFELVACFYLRFMVGAQRGPGSWEETSPVWLRNIKLK